MATTKKTVSRPVKRTRAEVEKEFSQLRTEVEQNREDFNAKADEASRLHQTEVRQGVEGISVDGVVQRISSLSLEVTKALAGLSEQLVDEVKRLELVREAVELENRNLQRFHQI